MYTQTITPGTFIGEIANCRTFLLEAEAEELRRQGLGIDTGVDLTAVVDTSVFMADALGKTPASAVARALSGA